MITDTRPLQILDYSFRCFSFSLLEFCRLFLLIPDHFQFSIGPPRLGQFAMTMSGKFRPTILNGSERGKRGAWTFSLWVLATILVVFGTGCFSSGGVSCCF